MPDRNAENNYLDFSEADVDRLQIIALLRQYNVPVGAVDQFLSSPAAGGFTGAAASAAGIDSFVIDAADRAAAAVQRCQP